MRIAIITNVIPVYRKVFYEKLLRNEKYKIKIYCTDSVKGMNLELCHEDFPGHVRILNHWGLNKESFTWQNLPIRELLNENDIFIFYGNPRVFSNVVWSSLFILMGKTVSIWGQAHTANSNEVLEKIRLIWWRLSNYIFVYTDDEVVYLRSRGFKNNISIIGMNNGLDQEAIDLVQVKWTDIKIKEWLKKSNITSKCMLLSCARLVDKNKFGQVIEALSILKRTNPDILWCVIGDGPEKDSLLSEAKKFNVDNHILWLGSIYDENDLAPWFMSSKLMIHPGAIGLSLLHSFGYGLPVVTHDDKGSHMPEFAALSAGENGLLFVKDDIHDMARVISHALRNQHLLHKMKSNAYLTARSQYNVNIMVSRFNKLIESMKQGSTK